MTFRHTLLTPFALLATVALAACSSETTAPLAPPSVAASSSSSNGGSSAGSSASGAASAARVRLEIALKGSAAFANAKGKAKWSAKSSERELQIEIEYVAAGTPVNFYVGGVQVGTTQVTNALRQASLNLNSTLGQSVPASVTGKTVEVKTAAGALVASGSF